MRTKLRTFLLTSILVVATTACVKLPRRAAFAVVKAPTAQPLKQSSTPFSINRASREELEKLPGIGPALAARIIEQRERHGPFRRVEHLLIVRGISERRFREIRALITVE